ncbi:MAG: hypothetical protein OEZ13_08855 [Spirochaetia bacterium]|nr:hypothetical protein [Spirochaetia bacterium]
MSNFIKIYRNKSKRTIRLISLFLIFALFIAWNFGTSVINVDSKKKNSEVTLYFKVEKGYGVQKDGPHQIEIYKLSPEHVKENKVSEKIKKYGALIQAMEKIKGKISSEDSDYFESVDPVEIKNEKLKNGQYAFKAIIYYCSFADKFCSAQRIEKLIY